MCFRKEKVWSGDKMSWHIGYDLWGWAIPLVIDKDYGLFTVKVLCFYLAVAWDYYRRQVPPLPALPVLVIACSSHSPPAIALIYPYLADKFSLLTGHQLSDPPSSQPMGMALAERAAEFFGENYRSKPWN